MSVNFVSARCARGRCASVNGKGHSGPRRSRHRGRGRSSSSSVRSANSVNVSVRGNSMSGKENGRGNVSVIVSVNALFLPVLIRVCRFMHLFSRDHLHLAHLLLLLGHHLLHHRDTATPLTRTRMSIRSLSPRIIILIILLLHHMSTICLLMQLLHRFIRLRVLWLICNSTRAIHRDSTILKATQSNSSRAKEGAIVSVNARGRAGTIPPHQALVLIRLVLRNVLVSGRLASIVHLSRSSRARMRAREV